MATLKKEDLTSKATLRLLEDEDMALVTTNVGQRKMLQAAVKNFRVTREQCMPAETTVTGSPKPQTLPNLPCARLEHQDRVTRNVHHLHEAGRSLDSLLSAHVTEPLTAGGSSRSRDDDPQAILTVRATSRKLFT